MKQALHLIFFSAQKLEGTEKITILACHGNTGGNCSHGTVIGACFGAWLSMVNMIISLLRLYCFISSFLIKVTSTLPEITIALILGIVKLRYFCDEIFQLKSGTHLCTSHAECTSARAVKK